MLNISLKTNTSYLIFNIGLLVAVVLMVLIAVVIVGVKIFVFDMLSGFEIKP